MMIVSLFVVLPARFVSLLALQVSVGSKRSIAFRSPLPTKVGWGCVLFSLLVVLRSLVETPFSLAIFSARSSIVYLFLFVVPLPLQSRACKHPKSTGPSVLLVG